MAKAHPLPRRRPHRGIERALRERHPPVCRRKKSLALQRYGEGGHSVGAAYSLVETAKANGLEPFAYLKHIFTKLPQAKTLEDIEALLPLSVAKPATQSVAA